MEKAFKIGIFCTSSPVTSTPKDKDYAYLKSKGIEIYEHPQVRTRNAYLAGTIEDRVKALHEMLEDDSIDALMAYWGGANTNQLIPYLNYDLLKKFNKPIIGFSDTTALLIAVNKLSGIRTYVGPAGVTFAKPEPFEYTFEYFKKLIMDKQTNIKIEDSPTYADDLYFLRPDSDHRIIKKNKGRKVFQHGKCKGETIAANLQTLLVLAGTQFFPDLDGKVLFLEEAETVDPSIIHRFFTHLSQVTDLNKLAGICIGRFCEQSGFGEKVLESFIYEDVFKNINIPIIYNLDFGHSDPMFTVPIGAITQIDTETNLLEFNLI